MSFLSHTLSRPLPPSPSIYRGCKGAEKFPSRIVTRGRNCVPCRSCVAHLPSPLLHCPACDPCLLLFPGPSARCLHAALAEQVAAGPAALRAAVEAEARRAVDELQRRRDEWEATASAHADERARLEGLASALTHSLYSTAVPLLPHVAPAVRPRVLAPSAIFCWGIFLQHRTAFPGCPSARPHDNSTLHLPLYAFSASRGRAAAA